MEWENLSEQISEIANTIEYTFLDDDEELLE